MNTPDEQLDQLESAEIAPLFSPPLLAHRFDEQIRTCVADFFTTGLKPLTVDQLIVAHDDSFQSSSSDNRYHFYVFDADGKRYGVSGTFANGTLLDLRCGRV